MSKLHHSFIGTLANAIANDLCVANMEIGGILVNATNFAVYVRTKVSSPSVVGDWSLFTGSSGGPVYDTKVTGLSFNSITNILTLLQNDGFIFNADLSALKTPVGSTISFNNAGTNFISTTVEAAIKELNTNRPWAKSGTLQSVSTTNKAILVNDNMYHNGRVSIGSDVLNGATLNVRGGASFGIDNYITGIYGAESALLGGVDNEILSNIFINNRYGSYIIGGKQTTLAGDRILSLANFNMYLDGSRQLFAMNDGVLVTGSGNTVFQSNNGSVNGINNSIQRSYGVNIYGSNNTTFYMSNIAEFENSNNNFIAYAQDVEKITGASRNIILKALAGSVRASDNLIWGKNLHLLSALERSDNVVLGQNIYVGGNNSFIWSATQDTPPGYIGVDPSVDNNGVFALYDNSAYANFSSVVDNEFMARFVNGYRLRTNAAGTVGVDLAAGGSSWSAVSSILTKDIVHDTININELIDRLENMTFKIYKFKDDSSNTNFLSTTAEEWHTLMNGFTTPEYARNSIDSIPAIRTNDQISLALMLIKDIYNKLKEMSN